MAAARRNGLTDARHRRGGAKCCSSSADETATWNGVTVDATTVIVKYTYVGDADLNGYVDAVDYGTVDNWIQFPGTTGYGNGDFNYDGVIDAVDYGTSTTASSSRARRCRGVIPN